MININEAMTKYDGVYDEEVHNYGTIKGGIFNRTVSNIGGRIEGGVFKAEVKNSGNGAIIAGGEFHGTIINQAHIENATLKTGATIVPYDVGVMGSINKLTIDGNVKLNNDVMNTTNSIQMLPNSTLELDSIPDFRKIQNMQNIKVNGKELIFKNGVLENHDNIDNGYFNMPVINQKDGVINGGYFNMPVINEKDGIIKGGRFENLENHGVINKAELDFKGNFVETFKNYGIINDGVFIARNTYNLGTIKGGIFAATVHNENGTIAGGRFDNIELLSGKIQDAVIYKELTIKGEESIGRITLQGGFSRLIKNGFPKINNEAGVTIEKLDIWGKVKLSASELSHVKSVELLQVKDYGGTILYLDSVPDFSKIKGSGTIKVGNLSYNTDGSIISSQNNAVAFVNNSFKLDLAVKKAAEQKSSYIDEKNAQNAQNQQVDLLATPQNSDDNLI